MQSNSNIHLLSIVITIIIIIIIFIIIDFMMSTLAITIIITIILNIIIIITTTAIIITIIIFINNFNQLEITFLGNTQAKRLNHFLTLGMSSHMHKTLHRLIIPSDINLIKSIEVHLSRLQIFLL